MTQILNTISRILLKGNSGVSDVWQSIDGFTHLLTAINSLEGVFDTVPIQDIQQNSSQNTWDPNIEDFLCIKSTDDQIQPQIINDDSNSSDNGNLIDIDDGNDNNNNNNNENYNIENENKLLNETTIKTSTDIIFNCLKAAIECMAIALSPRVSEHAITTSRKYFREYIKYPTLTNSLSKTGIFSSVNAKACVELLFNFVSGCDDKTHRIANPDAMTILLDIVPLLPLNVAYDTIQLIKDYAFSQIDGCKLLSQAGIMRLFVEKYQSLLRDNNHPLKPALSSLLLTLCSEYLTIIDFTCILRNLVRPDAILSQKTQKLLPLWEVLEKKGVMAARSWDSVKFLIDLTETSTARSHGVPYVSLGPGVSRIDEPAYLQVHWSEQNMGKPFPVLNFSFSCWAQLGNSGRRPTANQNISGNLRRHGIVPLFCLRGANGGVFELQIDVVDSSAKFILQGKGKSPTIITFSLPYISEHEWHLIVVTVKKPKRVVTTSKVVVSLYLDGQSIFNDKIETEIPVTGPSVDLLIGKSVIIEKNIPEGNKITKKLKSGDNQLFEIHNNNNNSTTASSSSTTTSTSNIELMRLWHIGPILFFDDALTQVQVSRIMTKGPTYTGIFRGESPLEDDVSSVVTDMLCKCNSTFLEMDVLMTSLGLKGMELIVVPIMIENLPDGYGTFTRPGCPPPVLAYSATSTKIIHPPPEGYVSGIKSQFRVYLHNSASDYSSKPTADLHNGWHISRIDSVSQCVASLGGPSILMPLVHVASTEKQLLLSLTLLKECFRSDTSNMKYMHSEGYHILSYILNQKPKEIITENVIESLFSWAVDRGLKSSNSNVFSILLVDTLAFHHFILNHQIWDVKRANFALLVITLCRSLVCEDARHASLNAIRLGILGVVKWTLSLLIFGADKSISSKFSESVNYSDEINNLNNWNIKNRSATEESNSRDAKDPFLSNSIFVLRAILTFLPRRSDLTDISNTILKTLVANSTPQIFPMTPSRKRATSNPVLPIASSGSEKSSDSNYIDDNEPLSSSISLRISLIRLLKDLYCYHIDSEEQKINFLKNSTDDDPLLIFYDILTPRWFMIILEKSNDTATVSSCLRLLGCMMSRDIFRRKFCLYDPGLKNLSSALLSNETCLVTPIILPLVGLFFQIPMKFLPMPNDAKVELLVDIMDKFPGPLMNEPDLSEFTLPMFSIILESFTINARHKVLEQKCQQNIIISSMLLRAMVSKTFDGMRDLMQNKQAIEILVLNLLMCSNAWDDYGSHIYLPGTENDLSMSLQEDYIPNNINELDFEHTIDDSIFDPRRNRRLSDPFVTFQPPEIKMISPEGDELEDILLKVLTNTITKFSTPHNIAYFFLAFPRNMNEQYVCSYQILLFNKIKRILKPIFDDLEQDSLQSACNVFNFLIPIAKSRLLHENVLIELFHLSLYALEAVGNNEAVSLLHDRQINFVKDLGSSARCYAILNLHMMFNYSSSISYRSDKKLKTIELIRSNIHVLCPSNYLIFDDISDISLLKQRKDIEEKKTTLSILDSYGINIFPTNIPETTYSALSGASAAAAGVIVGKKTANQIVENTFTLAINDKWKTSQFLPLYLLIQSHSLFLDDEQSMRTEAMRICASLIIHRRQLMIDLLTPNRSKRTSSIVDPNDDEGQDSSLFNGFTKLLPTTGPLMYGKMLHSPIVDFEGESNRFAEFSYWLTDHKILCNTLFNMFEQAIHNSMPYLSCTPPPNAIKELINEKNKSELINNEESQVISFWNTECSSFVESILSEVRKWLVYGFSEIARGSINWKQVWYSLQSGPIWGLKPASTTSIKNSSNYIGDDEYSFHLTFTPLKIEDETDIIPRIPWKMDPAEGPEKTRRRIEQDYDFEVIHVGDEEIIDVDLGGLHSQLSNENIDNIDDDVNLSRSSDFSETFDFEELFKRVSSKGAYFRKFEQSVDEQDQFPDIDVELIQEQENDNDDDDDEEDDDDDGYDEGDDLYTQNNSVDDGTMTTSDETFASSPSSRFTLDTHRFSVKIFSAARAVRAVVGMDDDTLTTTTSTTNNNNNNNINNNNNTIILSSTPEKDPLSIFNTLNEDSVSNMTSTTSSILPAEYVYTSPNIDDDALRQKLILSELIKGIIGTEEWENGTLVNVSRINGLEARVALLIITPTYLHLLDGFQAVGDPTKRRITWTEIVTQKTIGYDPKRNNSNEPTSTIRKLPSRKKSFSGSKLEWKAGSEEETNWLANIWYQMLHSDCGYHKMPLDQVYTVFKRRHNLKTCAMEITDVNGSSLLFACRSTQECETTLKKLLELNMPSSIFHKFGLKNLQIAGGLFMYRRIMSYFLSYMTKLWQKGCISNLEYLMHLNAAAGRSFHDLTQYPVFPWVLADYESENLNLNSFSTYRDLSKPMGALGEKRAQQYAERYSTMAEFYKEGVEGATPPFFYGTHYSCAGYVLYYLMRLQPYSRMAISLQGGQFDKPDRLFKALEHSWHSASRDNLQDVRELVPEFYFLPEFLLNSNKFEFGETQKGECVDDVILPPWSGGDAIEFIRKHRQVLESKYVSENLHNWIDLIFGYKQRGPASEIALNVFIPLTYEGEVNIDAINDPMLKEATLAQINNFGQTPARLFSKPHPKKIVPDVFRKNQDGYTVDTTAIQWKERMTPPLSVVGATSSSWLNKVSFTLVLTPTNMGDTVAIGDIRTISKDRIIAVPTGCIYIPPKYAKFVRFGKTVGGLSIHVAQSSPRHLEVDKEVSAHEQLHLRPVTCVDVSSDGELIVTGSSDRSVRLWKFCKFGSRRMLEHQATYSGHDRSIISVSLCTEFSIIVSGSNDHTAMVWDIRGYKLLRVLDRHTGPVVSVSVNPVNGYIYTLTSRELRVYTMNGELLAVGNMNDVSNPKPRSKIVISLPIGEWQDGFVAVTGHDAGHVYLWKLNISIQPSEDGKHVLRELESYPLPKTHRSDITTLRLCSSTNNKTKPLIPRIYEGENNYELLIGDSEGYASRWAPGKLEQLSPNELQRRVIDIIN